MAMSKDRPIRTDFQLSALQSSLEFLIGETERAGHRDIVGRLEAARELVAMKRARDREIELKEATPKPASRPADGTKRPGRK